MVDRISTEEGLIDFYIHQRPRKKSFLEDVDCLIDWAPVEKVLLKHYKKRKAADGRPTYPPLALFKMFLIQRWYALSNPGLEEAVNDRLSFLRFTGLSFKSSVPDEMTICHFRNELIKKGLYKKLLDKINGQLEARSILVKQGAIVDAALVQFSRRLRKIIEVIPEDRQANEPQDKHGYEVKYSDDVEAGWVKKGGQPHYGYKVHMATDVMDVFILGGRVTPANHADTSEFERVVVGLNLQPDQIVLTDKGYCIEKNRDFLKQWQLHDGIMWRADRAIS